MMLGFIESQLVSTAQKAQGNSFSALIKTWAKIHHNDIPHYNIERVFLQSLTTETGLLFELISKSDNNLQARLKIVTSMLDVIHKSNMDMFIFLQNGLFANHSVSEWAIENNFDNLLKNPMVKKEQFVKEIKDLYLAGEIQEARDYADSRSDELGISTKEIFKAIGQYITATPSIITHNKNELMKDLIQNHDISVLDYLNEPTDTDISKRSDTPQLVQIAHSIQNILYNKSNGQEISEIKRQIEDYLSKDESVNIQIKEASELLELLSRQLMYFQTHPSVGSSSDESLQYMHFTSLCLTLLDHGAIPNMYSMPHIEGLIQHPNVQEMFSQLEPMEQQSLLQAAEISIETMVVLLEKKLINSTSAFSSDSESPFYLKNIDPKTNQPYTLHEFIMAHDQCRDAYDALNKPLENYMKSFLHEVLLSSSVLSHQKDEARKVLRTNTINDFVKFINQFENRYGDTALTYSALEANHELTEFCLAKMRNRKLLQCNQVDKHALHYAAENPKAWKVLSLLLKDNQFKSILNNEEKSRYMQSPLHLAVANKNDNAIQMIATAQGIALENNIASLPGYGELPVPQNILNDKLRKYIELMRSHNPDEYKEFKITDVIGENGMCAGWGFLMQIYDQIELPDRYYNIMQGIAEWDETLESLDMINENLSETYKNQAELFDNIISHLVVTQATLKILKNTELGLKQSDRVRQFDLIRPGNKEINEFKLIPYKPKTPLQVAEWLKILIQFTGSAIDIGIGNGESGHAVTIMVEANNKARYYDSNFMSSTFSKIPINIELIQAALLTSCRKIHCPNFEIMSDCRLYQIKDDKGFIHDPEKIFESTDVSSSPNQFSHTHLAIFIKHLDYLSKDAPLKEIFTHKAADGHTPLVWARMSKDREISSAISENLKNHMTELKAMSYGDFVMDMLSLATYSNDVQIAEFALDKIKDLRQHGDKLGEFLIQAIELENYDVALTIARKLKRQPESLLHVKTDPPYKDYNALLVALDKGNAELAYTLYEMNPEAADYSVKAEKPKKRSVRTKKDDEKIILAPDDKVVTNRIKGHSVLSYAIQIGQVDFVLRLISKSLKHKNRLLRPSVLIDGKSILAFAIENKYMDLAKFIIENKPRMALMPAYQNAPKEMTNLAFCLDQGEELLAKSMVEKCPEANIIMIQNSAIHERPQNTEAKDQARRSLMFTSEPLRASSSAIKQDTQEKTVVEKVTKLKGTKKY